MIDYIIKLLIIIKHLYLLIKNTMILNIDFKKIKNNEELQSLLYRELRLFEMFWKWLIDGKEIYWFNFSAFIDSYSHLKDNDTFILTNIKTIKDKIFYKEVNTFIKVLEDLKKTNPNFDYKIES